MRFVAAAEIDAVLAFPTLVETLRSAFRDGAVQPTRHHHTITRPSGTPSTLLLMPAWSDFASQGEGFVGVKVVTVSPDNNLAGKPAVMGSYMLLDGLTCEPLALIDGQRLTLWRTAAASALASTYLSRPDSRRLLVVGAGALAPFLARARVYVDTRDGALKEAGDIVQAIAEGALKPEGVRGDLYDLTRGKAPGRTDAGEITLFKSVGAAIEDLAAGIAVWKAIRA